ncbi:hypothetical protein [Paenibacillus soyae]|uniref:Methanol dehydrogenase n=1 Tax=Paenibacillus soyae TaxID=2969249 RepID=A0A9X2SDN0_9BACL|nr:hypothetical protein [Paenibacillus soyae]MCR2808043.1 hypothetical protein [Paenibacillus soyae]
MTTILIIFILIFVGWAIAAITATPKTRRHRLRNGDSSGVYSDSGYSDSGYSDSGYSGGGCDGGGGGGDGGGGGGGD